MHSKAQTVQSKERARLFKFRQALLLLVWPLCLGAVVYGADETRTTELWYPQVRALHLMAPPHHDFPRLLALVQHVLPEVGVNTLVLEVNYRFTWKTHPELREEDPLTPDDVAQLVAVCRQQHIRVIPEFNCLGHQSWGRHTFPLLARYPQFDETPNIPLDNPGIYCRSWCPSNPDLLPIIKDLLTELVDAFRADAIHLGMDEVFLIATPQCPRCRGHNPAELFTRAVKDLYQLTQEIGVQMWMWGDRLLPAKKLGYDEWEASENDTWHAIEQIPKDIVICDWHYNLKESYPSISYFTRRGFRVIPAGWRQAEASRRLIDCALSSAADQRLLGYMATTWTSPAKLADYLLNQQGNDPETVQIADTMIQSLAYWCQKTRLDMQLRLDWSNKFLTITSPFCPPVTIHYLEAYCRSKSSEADWVTHTVIGHKSSLIRRAQDGQSLELEDLLDVGVLVRHRVWVNMDCVHFECEAKNLTDSYQDVQWAQPCVRVGAFTGHEGPLKDGQLEDYLSSCFIFLDGILTTLPTKIWATQARYTPGQVWAGPGVPLEDLNPRPLNPKRPSHGLIGCFSGDRRWILAVAFTPWQELFQGVARCIHCDIRFGGLKPGETKQASGILYILPPDPTLLRARFWKDTGQSFLRVGTSGP